MSRCFRVLTFRLLIVLAIASSPLIATCAEPLRVARLPARSTERSHPIDPALEIVKASLEYCQTNIEDYEALFVKRCRVDGNLPPLQYAKIKVRNRRVVDGSIATPMSVYLDFLKPSSVKGREVIWVENENDGDLVVHQGGFTSFVTVHIDPEGRLAMRGQRYSVKKVGIENLLLQVVATGIQDRQHGECEVTIRPDQKFGKSRCTVIEIVHPERRDHFRFHRAKLYFDQDLKLPIRYQAWTWPEQAGGEPVLDEEYNYFNLKVNVGLSASDFDPANPEYRYR